MEISQWCKPPAAYPNQRTTPLRGDGANQLAMFCSVPAWANNHGPEDPVACATG